MDNNLQGFECIGEVEYYTSIPLGKAGVYVFTSDYFANPQHIYYVGKAQCLRKRLYQYSEAGHSHAYSKIQLIGSQENQTPLVWVKYEEDNAVLENQLIQLIKPKYNIRVNEGIKNNEGLK